MTNPPNVPTNPPNVPTPPLTQKERIALAVSQLFVGLCIIFVAGTILHHYLPVPGTYGVLFEGLVLGIVVVLHVNRVAEVYQITEKDKNE